MHEFWMASLRAFFAFVLAFFVTKMLSKQYMARLTYFDFTVAVCIGALIGHVSNDYKHSFWVLSAQVVIFGGAAVIIGWVALRWRPVRGFLEGQPTVLMEKGKILDENMRRHRYNLDELSSQLRRKGIFDISHVEYAILEPGGHLSVLHKSEYRPTVVKDLKLTPPPAGLSVELIMDGKVLQENLSQQGLSKSWLKGELHKRGYRRVEEVYFAVMNSRRELFIDPYKDDIEKPVDSEGS